MAFLDRIKLGFRNNLITGKLSEDIELNKAIHKRFEGMDVGSFGLFDTAAPNFANYYPAVKAEDLVPVPADFVEPVFRALSEVIVHKRWNPVDFSKDGVLKNSMILLKGQTIYANHEMAVGNELGSIPNVSWEEITKQGSIIIPAGINAIFKIDGKSNPKIARGIMMDPPSIHSSSVTVEFLWEKSHADIKDEDFWGKLGGYDKEGNMYRRVATKVQNYHEISLVPHGADPFAQKKDDKGNIVNPKYASTTYNSEDRKAQKYFVFDFKQDIISNEENNTIPDETKDINDTDKNSKDMNEFLIAFCTAFGLTETATKEQVDTKITELNAKVDPTAEAEVTRLKGIETEYNTKKVDLTKVDELSNFKNTTLEKFRNKVIGLYNKASHGKPNDAILNNIKATSDLGALENFEIQYTTQLEEAFPATCKKCGSTEINRASATQPEGEKGDSKKTGDEGMQDFLKERKRKQLEASKFYSE